MYQYYEYFNPVLEVMKDKKVYHRKEVAAKVADFVELSDEEKASRIKTGRATYVDRVQWAMTYLKQAGALKNESRGQWVISNRGLDLLKTGKPVTLKVLAQFPEFVAFKGKIGTRKKKDDTSADSTLENFTPTELIDTALAQLDNEVQQELADILKDVDPFHFETICRDLLVAMGYGIDSDDLSYVTKKSGDGGIDAVIMQDPLGINTIYVQAKRHKNEIKETDIRNFLGALAQKPTQNGVFITIGSFSKDALNAINSANFNIKAIDGEALAKLMLQYKVGIEVRKTYHTYNINNEYFED